MNFTFLKNGRISFLYLVLFMAMAGLAACSSSKESTSGGSRNYVAPDYVKRDYKKMLVLVRVDPDIFRKRIEKSLIKEFKGRKYNVSGSLEFVTPELMKDTIALRNKVLELGFDAAIVVTYMGELSSISENYTYNGNVYSFFYGAYPVYDVDTRSNKARFFQADFYRLDGKGTQWRAGFSADLSGDPDFGLDNMSEKIRKAMENDKIL
jgi:hypothetical protein